MSDEPYPLALESGEPPSKDGLDTLEYAKQLLAFVKQRRLVQAPSSDSSTDSAIEELGLRRYQSPSPSPPTLSTTSTTTSASECDGPHHRMRKSHDLPAELSSQEDLHVPRSIERAAASSTLKPPSRMGEKSSLTNEIVANWMAKQSVPMDIPKNSPSSGPSNTRRSKPSPIDAGNGVFFHQMPLTRKIGRSSDDAVLRRTTSRRDVRKAHGDGEGSSSANKQVRSKSKSARKPPPIFPSSAHSSEHGSDSEDDNYGDELIVPVDVGPSSSSSSGPGLFTQARNGKKGIFQPPRQPLPRTPHSSGEEDDAVPLAQRIPRALEVQQSIRKQVQDERERRKRDRADPSSSKSPTYENVAMVEPRGRTASPRKPHKELKDATSSQEAALVAAQQQRARSQHRAGDPVTLVFPAEDLTRRLLKIQPHSQYSDPQSSISASHKMYYSQSSEDNHPSASSMPSSHPRGYNFPQPPIPSAPYPTHLSQPPVSSYNKDMGGQGLRHMRSFHGMPNNYGYTNMSSAAIPTMMRKPSFSRARAAAAGDARPSFDEPRHPYAAGGGVDFMLQNHPPVPPLPTSTKVNMQTMQQRPASPPPPPPSNPKRLMEPVTTTQMRIFVGDLQRFNMVAIGPHTMAKDVLEVVRSQGDVSNDERMSGGWMVFELNQDFGMERPLRNFEHLLEVSKSWNNEKTANAFMVKRTPLAAPLSTIPSSLPMRSGYVEYEVKKGKWSRRFLELKEHGLWISKGKGKEMEFLCSLSCFDAYIITKPYKSQRSFVFAVKSTDRISFFDDKSDYLHIFSCPDENGMPWVEAILLARSYILFQESHVLTQKRGTPVATSTGQGAGLARAATRAVRPNPNNGSSARANPAVAAPPFLNPLAPNFNTPAMQGPSPFEKGSLLAKRTADGM